MSKMATGGEPCGGLRLFSPIETVRSPKLNSRCSKRLASRVAYNESYINSANDYQERDEGLPVVSEIDNKRLSLERQAGNRTPS
jgi:hypothetical protein